jgi:hypothetical protein
MQCGIGGSQCIPDLVLAKLLDPQSLPQAHDCSQQGLGNFVTHGRVTACNEQPKAAASC